MKKLLFIAFSLVFALTCNAQKLSDLTLKGSIEGTEKIPVSGAGYPGPAINGQLIRRYVVHDSINSTVTSIAPSQKSVYNALAAKWSTSGTTNVTAASIVGGVSFSGGQVDFRDNYFTLLDDGDISKVAKFQVSGITAGVTRTYTFPNASGTLVLTSDLAGIGGVSGLTTNRIPYATSSTTLGDDSNLTWDNTNKAITLGTARFHSPDKTADDLYIGQTAGNFTSTGTGANVGIGYLTGNGITNGSSNVFVGYGAGGLTSSGIGNAFFGAQAGINVTTGSQNIVIGRGSTNIIVTGNLNVSIGDQIDLPSGSANGQLSLQNILFGKGNTATGSSISTGQLGIGNNNPSHQLTITGNATNKSLFLVEEDGGTDYLNIAEAAGIGSITSNVNLATFNLVSGIQFAQDPAATNTVVIPVQLIRTTTGTAASGIGTGIGMLVEDASGGQFSAVNLVGIGTTVTAGSGAGKFEIRTMTAGATPTSKFGITTTGVSNDELGFKHARITTGSITNGSSAAVTLTWTTAFADSNYTCVCSVLQSDADAGTLEFDHIESQSASAIVVRITNDDGAAAKTGTLHCIAVHD